MKCEICGAGIEQNAALFRVNESGVKGIWRCKTHLSFEQEASIQPEVKKICYIIESYNHRKENGY